MNFHEYQAKELFASYGIPVPAGIVAASPLAAVEAARESALGCDVDVGGRAERLVSRGREQLALDGVLVARRELLAHARRVAERAPVVEVDHRGLSGRRVAGLSGRAGAAGQRSSWMAEARVFRAAIGSKVSQPRV